MRSLRVNESRAGYALISTLALSALSVISCSGDDARVVNALGSESDAPASETTDPETTDPEGSESSGSAIIFSILVRQPEGFTEYLSAQPNVPEGDVDLSRALEISGGGNWYPQPDALYLGNFERKSLERYQVNADYSVSKTGEASFLNYAIDFLNQEPLFFSDTVAYYLDAYVGQIVVFNPSTMTITGEMQLPELHRDGYEASLGDVVKVGDRYVGTIIYSGIDGASTAVDSTIGIVVQDDPDQPLVVLRDERGTSAGRAFVDEGGDFYALADAGGGWYGLTGQQSTVLGPRLLRVKNGATEVDPDYLLDIGELLGTPAANGLWHVGGSKFALQIWAPEIEPTDVLKEIGDYDVEPYFDWWVIDAVTGESQPIQGLERGVPSYTLLQLKDGAQTYLQQYVLPNKDYDAGHVELFLLGSDAVAHKVAQTSRGDFRVMARLGLR